MSSYRNKIEKIIDRKLLSTEIVHHLNGNHLDNRIGNLQICSSSIQHRKFHRKIVNAPNCPKCGSGSIIIKLMTGELVCNHCHSISKFQEPITNNKTNKPRCKKCNSSTLYIRIKTKETVCRRCGAISPILPNKKVNNGKANKS